MMKITKYEKAHLIGTRATQIANGAKPTVDFDDSLTAIDIAEKEFKMNKSPIIIRRTLPNGTYIDIKASELYE